MKLILFDFDGTLTTKDSFLEFIKFTDGQVKFYLVLLLLSPVLVGMKLGFVSNEYAKALLLAFFYKGKSQKELEALGEKFSAEVLPNLLRPKGLAEIQKHQADNQELVLVSASVDFWLKPFAHQMKMKLICTKAAYENGEFIGKFDGKNCIGPEKVKRICKQYELEEYEALIAYGDSKGDREMLTLADQAFFRPFRN